MSAIPASISPQVARRAERRIDIRALLGRIQTPCLVVVRTEDVWLSVGNSRCLAEHIPGAQLLELPGVDHDPWVGDTEPVLQLTVDELIREGNITPLPRVRDASTRHRAARWTLGPSPDRWYLFMGCT